MLKGGKGLHWSDKTAHCPGAARDSCSLRNDKLGDEGDPSLGSDGVQPCRVWTWWAEVDGSTNTPRPDKRWTRSRVHTRSTVRRKWIQGQSQTWTQGYNMDPKSIQETGPKIRLETKNRVVLCLYKPIICTHLFSNQDILWFWSLQGTPESHFVSRMFRMPCDRKTMWTEENSIVSSLTFTYGKKIHYLQWNICWIVLFLNGIS